MKLSATFPGISPGADFQLYIKGTCQVDAQRFRVAMVDYLALKFPDMQVSMHFTTANDAIRLAIEDIVSAYIDLKNPRR